MKKLITARMVRQAHRDGLKAMAADRSQYIVTPEARSLAKDLGIALVEKVAGAGQDIPAGTVDESTVRQIIERVIERLPAEKRDPALIREVVLDVLKRFNK